MTPEQLLLSGIASITAALIWVSGKLWAKSEACEKDRLELRKLYEGTLERQGEMRGELNAYRKCGEAECPFKGEVPNHLAPAQ